MRNKHGLSLLGRSNLSGSLVSPFDEVSLQPQHIDLHFLGLHIVVALKFSVFLCATVVVSVGLFCETNEVFIADKLIDAVDDVNFLNHFLFFFFEGVCNLFLSLSLQNKNSVVTELNTPVDENSKLTV